MKKVLCAAAVAMVLVISMHVGNVRGENYTIYWGDIHSHTAYSDDAYVIQKNLGLEPGRPQSALDYAKQRLDFLAVTDHAEHTEVYRDENGNIIYDGTGQPIDEWQDIRTRCSDSVANDPLIVFTGFEFTKTGEDELGNDIDGAGHKCVLFKDANVPPAPISSVEGEPTPGSPYCALPTDLWNQLSEAGHEYMTIPHHPAKGTSAVISPETDMSTDWSYTNRERQLLVEIFSVHGSSDYNGCDDGVDGFRAERSVESALNLWLSTGDAGYKLGIIASTDNHLSKPGSIEEHPDNMVHQEGDYTGGLVAALATERSREGIWEALIHKRVYGTTGPRIKLNAFTVTTASGTYHMGETVKCAGTTPCSISLHLDIETDTADVERIVITKSTVNNPVNESQLQSGQPWIVQTAESHPLCEAWSGKTVSLTVSDAVEPPRAYYRVTVYQKPTARFSWNGIAYVPKATNERAWSSPIFIEYREPGVCVLPVIILPLLEE